MAVDTSQTAPLHGGQILAEYPVKGGGDWVYLTARLVEWPDGRRRISIFFTDAGPSFHIDPDSIRNVIRALEALAGRHEANTPAAKLPPG